MSALANFAQISQCGASGWSETTPAFSTGKVASLVATFYEHGLMDRTEMLPAWCNWIFNGMPVWDSQQLLLTEPFLPLHPIGILHLAGQKGQWANVVASDGGQIRVPVRFPEFEQFVEGERKKQSKKPLEKASTMLPVGQQ